MRLSSHLPTTADSCLGLRDFWFLIKCDLQRPGLKLGSELISSENRMGLIFNLVILFKQWKANVCRIRVGFQYFAIS